MTNDEARRILAGTVQAGATLKTDIAAIETSLTAVQEEYRGMEVPSSHKMTGFFHALNDIFMAEGSPEGTRQAFIGLGHLGTARSAASRFAESRTDKDAARALETLGFVGDALQELSRMAQELNRVMDSLKA